MKAATSQTAVKSRSRVDACKRHHDCFKEGSKNVFFPSLFRKGFGRSPKPTTQCLSPERGTGQTDKTEKPEAGK